MINEPPSLSLSVSLSLVHFSIHFKTLTPKSMGASLNNEDLSRLTLETSMVDPWNSKHVHDSVHGNIYLDKVITVPSLPYYSSQNRLFQYSVLVNVYMCFYLYCRNEYPFDACDFEVRSSWSNYRNSSFFSIDFKLLSLIRNEKSQKCVTIWCLRFLNFGQVDRNTSFRLIQTAIV